MGWGMLLPSAASFPLQALMPCQGPQRVLRHPPFPRPPASPPCPAAALPAWCPPPSHRGLGPSAQNGLIPQVLKLGLQPWPLLQPYHGCHIPSGPTALSPGGGPGGSRRPQNPGSIPVRGAASPLVRGPRCWPLQLPLPTAARGPSQGLQGGVDAAPAPGEGLILPACSQAPDCSTAWAALTSRSVCPLRPPRDALPGPVSPPGPSAGAAHGEAAASAPLCVLRRRLPAVPTRSPHNGFPCRPCVRSDCAAP